MAHPADLILVQTGFAPGIDSHAESIHADCAAFCAGAGMALTLQRLAWPIASDTAYLYARLPERMRLDNDALAALVSSFKDTCRWSTDVRVSPLECMFDVPGASAGHAAPFHYVVETDPEEGWMDEIARWYDTEHMPGLAAVPGCVRASRYLNHGTGPRSLACYDLESKDVLGCSPWLAVRLTAWSDIARPHFTNTLRTMFQAS